MARWHEEREPKGAAARDSLEGDALSVGRRGKCKEAEAMSARDWLERDALSVCRRGKCKAENMRPGR